MIAPAQAEEMGTELLDDFIPRHCKIEHFRDFIRACKIDLYPYQLDAGWKIIKSILTNSGDEILLEFARQSGKTEMVADVSYFMTSTFPTVYKMSPWVDKGFKIGIYGPKKEQADICYDRVRERFEEGIIEDLLGIQVVENNASKIKLSNKSIIYCSTASITATVEGPTHDLVIVEEAQDVDDMRLVKSIFPMLAHTNGTRVLVGTATPEHKGYFYRALKRSKSKIEIPYTEGIKYSEYYKKYIESEKRRLGENSEAFRSQYMLIWPSSDSSYIHEEELYVLRRGNILEKSTDPCYYGIDVGQARDSTLMTILRDDGRILNWLELTGEDYKDQRDVIISFSLPYNLISGNIDANGPGKPLYDFLVDASPQMKNTLNKFDSSLQSNSEANIYLHQKLIDDEISYPKDETVERFKFENQMLQLEKNYAGKMMRVSAPSKNEHDDYFTSLKLAVMASKTKKKRYLGYASVKR